MIEANGTNLFFLISLPRSGSTLLSALLGNHPRLAVPPEPWFLLRLAEVYGPPAQNKVFDDVVASLAVKSFMPWPEFVDSARAFALQAYNGVLSRNGMDLFVDKTPRYYHILPFLRELFPAAKMIWLKRNPLDVAASIVTTWGRGIDVLTGDVFDPVSCDLSFGLGKIREFFDPASADHHEVNYEALVTDPAGEMERLARFCGVEYSDSLLDLGATSRGKGALRGAQFGDEKIHRTPGIHGDSIGLWTRVFSRAEALRLTTSIGREMYVRMGYREFAEANPELFPAEVEPTAWAGRQRQLQAQADAMRITSMGRIYDLEGRWNESQRRIVDMQRENECLKRQREEQTQAGSALRDENERLRRRIQAFERSIPYRLSRLGTLPGRVVRRLRGRGSRKPAS